MARSIRVGASSQMTVRRAATYSGNPVLKKMYISGCGSVKAEIAADNRKTWIPSVRVREMFKAS